MSRDQPTSDEAVLKATGKSWDEWIALLDGEGADALSHREIAALLIDRGHIERKDQWWAQAVTVGYEYAKGRRVTGETADAGFQMSTQKTIAVDADRLWRFLASPEGLRVWLGAGTDDLVFEKGATYRTDNGTEGEIRSVYPQEKLRLTWKPADWETPSTLQLYLEDKTDRTGLLFHHEKLADARQRDDMKGHWQNVLKRIEADLL